MMYIDGTCPHGRNTDNIAKNLPELADGWVTLNEKPGLGLELNEEAVKEFKSK